MSRSFLLSASINCNRTWSSSFSWCTCSISSKLESNASVIWALNLFTLSSSTLFSSFNLKVSSSIVLFSSSSSSTSACSSLESFFSSSNSLDSDAPWLLNWPKMLILHWTALSQVLISICSLLSLLSRLCSLLIVVRRTFLSFCKMTSSSEAEKSSYLTPSIDWTFVSAVSSSSKSPRSSNLFLIIFNCFLKFWLSNSNLSSLVIPSLSFPSNFSWSSMFPLVFKKSMSCLDLSSSIASCFPLISASFDSSCFSVWFFSRQDETPFKPLTPLFSFSWRVNSCCASPK